MSELLACTTGEGYWSAVFIEGNQRILLKLTQRSDPFRRSNEKASYEFLFQRLGLDAQEQRDQLKSDM